MYVSDAQLVDLMEEVKKLVSNIREQAAAVVV
jgi:hypothetical protein